MQASALRDRVTTTLLDFARDEWAQLGIFLQSSRPPDSWVQDPEALLVFTLDVARDDARLFDEILDWLRLNGRAFSGRRLSRLAHGDGLEGALVSAAVEWAADHGSPLRMHVGAAAGAVQPISVFDRPGIPGRSDEIFLRHGFVKPATRPSGKSSSPDLRLPINLAFRLRSLLGVSSRAEIVRFLLTSGTPDATTLAIAEAAVSTKRNVNDALKDLATSGVIERFVIGNEARYGLDRNRWASFLGLAPDAVPAYRDWASLLAALGEIRRWLRAPEVDGLSEYLRASEARRLVARVKPALERTGVAVVELGIADEYWPSFIATVENALSQLDPATKANRLNL